MLDLPLTDNNWEANSFTDILRLAFAISGKMALASDAAILKEGPPSTSSLFATMGTKANPVVLKTSNAFLNALDVDNQSLEY